MATWIFLAATALLLVVAPAANAFGVHFTAGTPLKASSASSSMSDAIDDVIERAERPKKLRDLKTELLQLGASYNRGFGASSSARKNAEVLIRELESLNEESDAARGIDGPASTPDGVESPLTGNWRMIWTTAQDVLVLGANPLVTVGAIYQIFQPPVVTNIIDFLPRVQSLLPIPSSLLRAKVRTKASSRVGFPMRVGLDFEAVNLQPEEFLGQSARTLPPLGFDLPKLFELPDDVGYFDVAFLDEDMLIIRQNAPGGLFVLAKTATAEP